MQRLVPILLGLLSACSSGAEPETRRASVVSQPGYLAHVARAERISDWVARCKSYPDLPGNRWHPGAAAARCELLQKPSPTLDEIERALTDAQGLKDLHVRYRSLLDARASGQHESIFLAYDVFDSSDRASEIADAWRSKAPDDPFALAAYGHQRIASAWHARGQRYASRTTGARFAEMEAMLRQAMPALERALRLEPGLAPACTSMIEIGRLAGSRQLVADGSAACVRADPAAWHVLRERSYAALSKWGGTAEDTHAVVEQARAHAKDNPMLGSLFAAEDARTPMMLHDRHRWADALPQLEDAAMLAPDPELLANAGIAAHKIGDQPRALVYLSQAIRFSPLGDYYFQMRATVRNYLGDHRGAVADAVQAIDLIQRSRADPSDHLDGPAQSQLAIAEQRLGNLDRAREAYAAAGMHAKQRAWAMRRSCEMEIVPAIVPERADACTAKLVEEYPDDAQAMFMRAWVLRSSGKPDVALEERFLSAADQRSAREAGMVSELRRLRGTR